MNKDNFHLTISRELGSINKSLENICRDVKEMKEHLATQSGKIESVEKDIMGIKTKAAMIASLAGTGVYFVWDFIKTKL